MSGKITKNYDKETPVIKYWSSLVIGAKYTLDVFDDGHAVASIIDDTIKDYFLEGTRTIEPHKLDSLAKRLFESMENLQYIQIGGGYYDDDEIGIQVLYRGQERKYRWCPPTEKTPNQLEEPVQELEAMHQQIPKKRIR